MSKHKLLLADDSITIQKVVNLTFADEGIEVISVGDGNAAIEKLAEFTPDLVMADINMPGLSGYEICERLRANEETNRIPVILLVGSFEPFDEEKARQVGANDFLTKPFQSIRQLVTKVSGLLDSADKTSTDRIISDLDMPAKDKVPGEFENTLEMETPEPAAEEFGDSGMDDEMIQTNQVTLSEAEDDPRITQPLTTAEFDEIHRSAEEERGYAFVSDSPFDEPTLTPQEISALAETAPLPQDDSFYQTQRVMTTPTLEAEDDANLLELPPQQESLSAAAYNTPVWQEEITPIEEKIETESINENPETDQSVPAFETEETAETVGAIEEPQVESIAEPSEEIQTEESDEISEEAESETEAIVENEPEAVTTEIPDETETAADEESAEAETVDIREAPTDEMIDLSEVGSTQDDADSNDVPQKLNLSPEVIDAIAAKVSERFSDQVLRELVEELKPQITELIAKKIAE